MSFFENMCEMTGLEPQTSFWEDFSTADIFGEASITNTFDRAFEGWKDNVVYLTELVMVLNWKIWYWNEFNEAYSKLYQSLWEKADLWAMENLKDDDMSYFLRTTD